MNWLKLSPLLLIIGGVLLLDGGKGIVPGPGPVDPADCLSECHVADRASQVSILRDAALQPRDTVDARIALVKWVNERRIPARTNDWIPYTDEVAKAIEAGTLSQLADTLENK